MNDQHLLTLIAETDVYPDTAPIPETIATPDEAFRNLIDWLEHHTPQRAPARQWRRTGTLVAAAAFVIVILIGAALWLLLPDPPDVIDPTPTTTVTTTPPTTQAAPPTTQAVPPTTQVIPTPAFPATPQGDLALAEAAVAAWYANDFETFSELVDMPGRSSHSGWTSDDFRNHMAYDDVVGGRVEADCTPPEEAGEFLSCVMPLHNELTDALGMTRSDLLSSLRVSQGTEFESMRVVDGRLSRYQFYDHQWIVESFAVYLATIDELTGYENCLQPPLNPACGEVQIDHLEGWSEWSTRDATVAIDIAQAHIEALFSGDCQTVQMLTTDFVGFRASECPALVEYEAIVGGTFDVADCTADTELTVTCDGSYRNALSDAVGAPSVSTPISIGVDHQEQGTWGASNVQSDHPVDEELLLSFRRWAIDTGLQEAVNDECGLATPRTTPRCATFLMDNLEAWAAWYPANS